MSSTFKIKCLFFCVLGTVITATSMFIFYVLSNNKELEINYLKNDEKAIENRHERSKDPFRLCVYPEGSAYCQVDWSDKENFFVNKAVKIFFRNSSTDMYAGMHLYLTIPLSKHVDSGIFEFWIKGNKGSRFVNKLNLYLKDGQLKQQMVYISLPVRISKEWQRISFPLSGLRLHREGGDITKEFSWTIQELLFSVAPVHPDDPVELYISGIRVTEGKEIIYDIS